MIVTVYANTTGQILRNVDAPPDLAQMQAGAGESLIAGRADDLTQYVNGGIIIDRPTMPGGLSAPVITTADTAMLAAQEGASVEITGPVNGTATLDADGLEISSDIPGTYTIKVTLFPYLDAEYTLEITEP